VESRPCNDAGARRKRFKRESQRYKVEPARDSMASSAASERAAGLRS